MEKYLIELLKKIIINESSIIIISKKLSTLHENGKKDTPEYEELKEKLYEFLKQRNYDSLDLTTIEALRNLINKVNLSIIFSNLSESSLSSLSYQALNIAKRDYLAACELIIKVLELRKKCISGDPSYGNEYAIFYGIISIEALRRVKEDTILPNSQFQYAELACHDVSLVQLFLEGKFDYRQLFSLYSREDLIQYFGFTFYDIKQKMSELLKQKNKYLEKLFYGYIEDICTEHLTKEDIEWFKQNYLNKIKNKKERKKVRKVVNELQATKN